MIKELLRSPRTFATPVLLYLVSVLGEDVVTYEPETIAEYLRKLEPSVHRSLIDRVVAATGLYTSNAFWYDPATFNIVSRALNRRMFPTNEPANLFDMAWGVSEASLLVDGEDTSDSFSEYVVRYIRYYLKQNGTYTAPDSLSFVGSVPFTPALDDESHAVTIQEESDRVAAEVDVLVNKQMLELLTQLKSLRLPLQRGAATDLDELIKEYSAVLI